MSRDVEHRRAYDRDRHRQIAAGTWADRPPRPRPRDEPTLCSCVDARPDHLGECPTCHRLVYEVPS